MLANHDQNVLVLFRLAQSICVYAKLESSSCRIYCVNLPSSIDWELDWLIETRADNFSVEFSNSAQARLTCRVLCFALGIKGKTLAIFWGSSLCCVCESFVRSRGGCLHTCLELSRKRFHWELDDHSIAALKSLKISKREWLYLLENPKKKKSVVSEFARGRFSKFSTCGSNKMLVVLVTIVKFRFSHSVFSLPWG